MVGEELNGCEGLGELPASLTEWVRRAGGAAGAPRNPIAGTLWMFHAKSLFVLFGFFMVDNCVP
jgi:hypothetical protein